LYFLGFIDSRVYHEFDYIPSPLFWLVDIPSWLTYSSAIGESSSPKKNKKKKKKILKSLAITSIMKDCLRVSTFIFWISPNLARHNTYGWSPLEQHHKIEFFLKKYTDLTHNHFRYFYGSLLVQIFHMSK
jgi:hypothetical protein